MGKKSRRKRETTRTQRVDKREHEAAVRPLLRAAELGVPPSDAELVAAGLSREQHDWVAQLARRHLGR